MWNCESRGKNTSAVLPIFKRTQRTIIYREGGELDQYEGSDVREGRPVPQVGPEVRLLLAAASERDKNADPVRQIVSSAFRSARVTSDG